MKKLAAGLSQNCLCRGRYYNMIAIKREKEILKHIINALMDIDIGIYPKSIVGKDGYKKRTDYMEGWNAAVIKQSDEITGVLEDLGIDVYDGESCLDPPIIEIT